MPPLLGSTGDTAKAWGFTISSVSIVSGTYYITCFAGVSQICSFNHGSVDSNMVPYVTGYNATANRAIHWKASSDGLTVAWQSAVPVNGFRGSIAQISTDGTVLYSYFNDRLFNVSTSTGLATGGRIITVANLANDGCATSTSNLYVCSTSTTSGVGVIWKFNMSGTPAVTWSRFYQDASPSTIPVTIYGVTKRESGALFASGNYSTGNGFVTKISDTDGSAVWLRRHNVAGGTGFQYNRCCSDSSDNVYIAGQYNTSALGANFWMTKVDTNGTLQWSAVLNTSTTATTDRAYSCCMSSDQSSVYFVGSASTTTVIINVNASTGAINWQRQITNTSSQFLNTAKIFANATTMVIMGDFTNGANRVHVVFALPADGTKTGTYTTTGTASFTWTYAASSLNYSTVTVSVSNTAWGGNANANATSNSTTTANTVTATAYAFTSKVAVP